jgi:CubicO group peptidase (beta-lactamase class C family)
MRSLLATMLVAFTAAVPSISAAQGYAGPTLAVAEGFRDQWTIANWDDGGPLSHYVFLNMSEFWPHSVIDRDGPVRQLAPTARQDVANFLATTSEGEMRLEDYVAEPTVDGMIVLHQGRIVFEAYPHMYSHEKHLYMSVSKPFASTLVGVLAHRGQLSVTEPIDVYLPELKDSGWEGVRVLDVLDMASGIDCRQSLPGVYDDPETCYYQFEAALGWLPPTDATSDDVHEWVAGLESRRPPGEAYEYTSVNTFVLRWLLERVAGRTYADLIETEIWQRLGAESDALIVAPKKGVPIAASGISSTLRDLARFGLLFTPTGRILNDPVVSGELLDNIQNGGRPEIFNAGREPGDERRVNGEPAFANSFQWDWIMDDGDFFKGGYGGQGLYISPTRDLVIAYFGTLDADGRSNELSTVARQLATSGLFD